MNQFEGLVMQEFGDMGIRMPESDDGNARSKVNVLPRRKLVRILGSQDEAEASTPVFQVPEIRALAAVKDVGRTGVSGEEVGGELRDKVCRGRVLIGIWMR